MPSRPRKFLSVSSLPRTAFLAYWIGRDHVIWRGEFRPKMGETSKKILRYVLTLTMCCIAPRFSKIPSSVVSSNIIKSGTAASELGHKNTINLMKVEPSCKDEGAWSEVLKFQPLTFGKLYNYPSNSKACLKRNFPIMFCDLVLIDFVIFKIHSNLIE